MPSNTQRPYPCKTNQCYFKILCNIFKKAFIYFSNNNDTINKLLLQINTLETEHIKIKQNYISTNNKLLQNIKQRENTEKNKINELLNDYNIISNQLDMFNINNIKINKKLDDLSIQSKRYKIDLNKNKIYQQILSKEINKIKKYQTKIYNINYKETVLDTELIENNKNEYELLTKNFIERKNILLSTIKVIKFGEK